MAVPTLDSVTPSSGDAGGEGVVQLAGTNFRLYAVPVSGYVGGDDPQLVRVTFDGVEATNVDVISATTLEVTPPMYTGDLQPTTFPPVDVTVTNLDDNGDPIAGETATLAASYTYVRQPLLPPTKTHDSPFERIARMVIQMFKREMLLKSGVNTHTDYSSDGIVIAQADVPTLHLVGPVVREDDYGWENEEVEEDLVDDEADIWPHPIMHTVTFTLIGSSDNYSEFLTMMAATRKILRSNSRLIIAGDVPAGSTLRLPIVVTSDPSKTRTAGNSNSHGFSATFELIRVPVLYLPPYLRTKKAAALELQAQNTTGSLVEVIAL